MFRLFIYLLYKFQRKVARSGLGIFNKLRLKFYLYIFNVEHSSFGTNGVPYLDIARNSRVKIGKNFRMNNGQFYNSIGYSQKCSIIVGDAAILNIGNDVGISQTAIVCQKNIEIGNNVKMGGGVKIYDTDFHSLDFFYRKTPLDDLNNKKTAKIKIGDDVFIGADSIVLKGVTIGDRSIVGAGSLVTKNVPNDEIWAGRPAKRIRNTSSSLLNTRN